MFGAASVICLSVLFVVAFGFCLYFLQVAKSTHALWFGAAAGIFAVIGVACYIQTFVIRLVKPFETAEDNRGYIELGEIEPSPPFFPVGQKIAAYITWTNDGNSPAEIKDGVIQYFISSVRPSENEISCPPSSNVVEPVLVMRGKPRTQKYIDSSDIFTPEHIAAINTQQVYFGICGQVHYVTVGQPDVYEFCTYYDPQEKAYIDCKKSKKK